MLATKPEDVNQLFIQHMRNGDIESVLELYDPEMAFVNPAGEIKRGIPAIRSELSEFAATKQLFQFHIRNVIQNGNIALVHNQWEMISPRKASGYAVEVMRLQPDGGWRFFIGDPFTIR